MNSLSNNISSARNPNNGNLPIEDGTRLEQRSFLWRRFSCFRTLSAADLKIQNEVISYFQQKYLVEDDAVFTKIWKSLGSKIWNPSMLFTEEKLKQIDLAFKNKLIYHGKGIEGPVVEGNDLSSRVQRFVHTLVHGAHFPMDIVERRAAKAIFVKHDPEVMDLFRQALQEELLYLAEHPPINENEAFIWNAFLGNVIALLPYSYPQEGTLFSIPRMNGSTCQLVTYSTEVITLDYPGVSSPMNALGLTPKDHCGTPNLLVFMGTTFPAGDGFAATIFSDFTPGHSVGELIYRTNKYKIEAWVKGKANITAIGLSLGGALVFHALRNLPHVFTNAEVFSPAGLYPKDWNEPVSKDCRVNIYTQKGDLVTKLGAFPQGSNISLFSILPHHEGVKETPLHAHLRIFSGCKIVTILNKSIEEENRDIKRIILTILHQYIAPFVIFLPFGIGFIGFSLLKKMKHATKIILSSRKD